MHHACSYLPSSLGVCSAERDKTNTVWLVSGLPLAGPCYPFLQNGTLPMFCFGILFGGRGPRASPEPAQLHRHPSSRRRARKNGKTEQPDKTVHQNKTWLPSSLCVPGAFGTCLLLTLLLLLLLLLLMVVVAAVAPFMQKEGCSRLPASPA